MEAEDIRTKYATEIGTIRAASQRSWFWLGVAGLLGTVATTFFIFPAIVPAITTMSLSGGGYAAALEGVKWGMLGIGAAIGGVGIVAARHSVSVDVDRDIQIEDINARRSAEYGAKALVKELEDAGLTVKPKEVSSTAHTPSTLLSADPREHQARVAEQLSLVVSK